MTWYAVHSTPNSFGSLPPKKEDTGNTQKHLRVNREPGSDISTLLPLNECIGPVLFLMNGLNQFYFEWMDWTSSWGDLWIPLWRLLSGQTWKLAQREGEEENLIFTEMCRIFFCWLSMWQKMSYQSQFNVWHVFCIWKRQSIVFWTVCLAMNILQMKRKKRKPIMILGQLAN